MNDPFKKAIVSLDTLSALKKAGLLNNPWAVSRLRSALLRKDPSEDLQKLQTAIEISKMFSGPFDIPDATVDGLIRFALTEQGIPCGINPEECHCLICGQTGCGKSTLLKIIFAEALSLNESQDT
jgi:polynucleotide 5'-kinase involved in rRNA processing